MKRIGVFVCHCGRNIGVTVDVGEVVKQITTYPGVAHCEDYKYMCSDPGQALIKAKIKEKKLDGIVVAACSPSLHETTFRRTASSVGLNPYLAEIANIREQCSWVHSDRDRATAKAIRIIKTVIEKAKLDEALEPATIPITRKALVIGGGVAGIQAALDIANSGYPVILVERSPSIGGHMAQLSETFPTLDCSQCILTPKMVEVAQNENIRLLTYSEVEAISGSVGNFKVTIRKKAAYVDHDKCTGCGICTEKCPKKIPADFNRSLGDRPAIYTLFPQAVPNYPVIDRQNCIYFTKGRCRICEKSCDLGAIDYDQEDEIVEEEVGAIVVATGFDTLPVEQMGEYGYGKHPDVIDGLAFERILSASGPTAGEVRRPSDGMVPKEVVFVQCAGSRDPEKYCPYCSKICCMYTAKHALLYKHRVHDGQPYVFYIDVRTGGKSYEEFYHRVSEEEGVVYIRGKVSKVFQDGDDLIVWGVDTLTGKKVEIKADLVVLATAMIPSRDSQKLFSTLKLAVDQNGFLSEAHPKLRPVESITAGFFLAGAAQGPRDIPETVAQAGGAASKVIALFSQEQLHQEPIVAVVDEDLCSGCKVCISACPYDARQFDEEKGVVTVNELLCEGCGACVVSCPTGATQQKNLTDSQIREMVKAVLGD
jgi:heterodisulfide reductase subunit A